jgi:hypothetical protein
VLLTLDVGPCEYQEEVYIHIYIYIYIYTYINIYLHRDIHIYVIYMLKNLVSGVWREKGKGVTCNGFWGLEGRGKRFHL